MTQRWQNTSDTLQAPDTFRVAEMLAAAQHAVVLTGAGISTPSGIPDFRSAHGGLWQQADPLEVASLWGFHDNPAQFYRWLRPLARRMLDARPNPAHVALARLEAAGHIHTVITQNIDSLHQIAGSRHVLELHGHARTFSCLSCGRTEPADGYLAGVCAGQLPPPCAACGWLLRPDMILYGEPLPYATLNAAQQAALACDFMLIIGTSLQVMPAADLPLLARRRGARLALINLTPTPLDAQMEVCIRADVVSALAALYRAVASDSKEEGR